MQVTITVFVLFLMKADKECVTQPSAIHFTINISHDWTEDTAVVHILPSRGHPFPTTTAVSKCKGVRQPDQPDLKTS